MCDSSFRRYIPVSSDTTQQLRFQVHTVKALDDLVVFVVYLVLVMIDLIFVADDLVLVVVDLTLIVADLVLARLSIGRLERVNNRTSSV